MVERALRCFLLHRFAKRGKKYLGVLIVLSHLDVSDGDQADARILEIHANDLGQFTLDLVGYAPTAGVIFRHAATAPENQPGAPSGGTRKTRRLQRPRHFNNFKNFQLVAFLDVVEVLQRQAAFEAGFDLAHIVLETLQRIEFTFMDDDVVAQQPKL